MILSPEIHPGVDARLKRGRRKEEVWRRDV
jgi:hypothetical protein